MKNYFYGWYFKCQTPCDTLAVIPAYHKTSNHLSASVQLITSERSEQITFPFQQVRIGKNESFLAIGDNLFTPGGLRLNIRKKGFTAYGFLRFGPFTPLSYDIMGPFSIVPFMECRHRIYSMYHSVNGALMINKKTYVFSNASGYMEGDRGSSFPEAYAWTHCFFPDGSLSLSVAEIPLGPIHFTGIICVIFWRGKEFRLATYLGARLIRWENGILTVRQGSFQLTARLLSASESSPAASSHSLSAPRDGAMVRTIHEHPSCRAYYHFSQNGRTLFSFVSQNASFEYETSAAKAAAQTKKSLANPSKIF